MRYADITRNDPNPLKRLVQEKRIADAISLVDVVPRTQSMLDFGTGDGELCKRLASRFVLQRLLERHFDILRAVGSLVPLFGAWLNSELYFLVREQSQMLSRA